jgi:hypothetical protein
MRVIRWTILIAGTAAWLGVLAVALWVPSYYARQAPNGTWFQIVGDTSKNGDELHRLAVASGGLGAVVLPLAGWRWHPFVRVALGLAGLIIGTTIVYWIAHHVHHYHDATV